MSGINSPENVEQLINKHAYRENIGDDELFSFISMSMVITIQLLD
jgi:hypothetical protein